MTQEQTLWLQEQNFWDRDTRPRIDDRHITEDNGIAVLSYRVTGNSRVLRCRSTYARACGAWMLLEHQQTAA
jgi:hypothetical protein